VDAVTGATVGFVTAGKHTPLSAELSSWRAQEPPGTLPHLARVLDADTAPTANEAAIDVELLHVDATSYAEIRMRCAGDPRLMAATIAEIVEERGKLQNPWTESGGVLMGTLTHVGPDSRVRNVQPGDKVMPVASLIAVPLRLDDVGPVDPTSPLVPATGRAIVTGRMLCARVPADLPAHIALAVFDVYPAASYVRSMADPGTHVLVLGAGHAGLLAIAAAREAVGPEGFVTAIDRSPQALARAREVDPATAVFEADVTHPGTVARVISRAADLTLLCTTVAGAEGAAIVATADTGTVLFFSTATSFAAAGLGADAVGSHARLVIPNGLTEDRGEYAFDLVRENAALREAFQP
jgi:L-erythro-3,5-diaminohexanoate dehydrogenase